MVYARLVDRFVVGFTAARRSLLPQTGFEEYIPVSDSDCAFG